MSKPAEPQAQAQNPEAIPPGQIAGMKAGEYLLHVFIEETRGLKHPKSADSTVDPIIEIKGFGKSRYSKVQKKVGSGATFWGEHYFFEKNFETAFELDSEKVSIIVSDHNTFGFDAVIGTVEVNLSTVYYKPGHVLEYQWAALSGLTKNYQDVLGFVKFSIGIFGTGDEQKVLATEKVLDSLGGPNKSNVLYPPQIITEPYQIKVKIFRGEKLKKMDTFGKTDPYVQVLYGGMEFKNTVMKVTLDPVWNEEIDIPASLPTINDFLTVRVFDWESGVQTNEILGSGSFDIKDIMANKYKAPFWMNIYGAPSGAKDPYKKQMNDVEELGTEWKGRLQLAITMTPEEKPVLGCKPIKDPALTKSAETIKRETLELRAEIHYAMNLRKDGEDYTVKIRWGPNELVTKKKSSKNRMIEIYESLTLPAEFPFSNAEDVEVPDVFIYINNGDKNLSYVRKSWTEFRSVDTKANVFYFKVDKSVTTTREDLAGIVKMRLVVARPQEKQALSMYGWDRPISKPQPKSNWVIHCNIYQAQDIVAGDTSGLSDAYLNVYFNGAEQSTTVINETVNPIWNERLIYSALFDVVGDAPPLFLTMWDKDVTSSDFLGSAMYVIKQSNLNPEELPKPEWVDFKHGNSGGIFGRVLLSICCYNKPDKVPRSPYIEPETNKYYINMKVLGLRQLESVGILPVRRAFVRFDVDSLRKKEDKSHLPEKKFLRTEPLNPGPNPNILTVINLDLNLPSDPDYCPSMGGAVFDYILKGISQPLIGHFSIPLGEYIKQTSAELEKRIEKLSKLYYATQNIQVNKPVEPRGLMKKLTTDKIKPIDTEETKGLDQTNPSHIEDDYSMNTAGASGNQPLLGKFMEPMVNQFEMIKKEKGVLPGESDDVKIDIFKGGESNKSSSAAPDPTDEISEEAKASQKFVIVSKYTKEGEEIERPDTNKYMELGHNNKSGTFKKHYRYALNTELEKSEFIDKSPFVSIPIYRGKKVPDESFLANIFGKGEDYRCVGYFKAMINVMSELDKIKYDAKIHHVGQFAQTKGLEFSDDEFLRRRDVTVRVYIVEADGLMDKDTDSNSDPYLVVKLGKTTYNEKDFYQLDNPNPRFYKCFEFASTLPGASKLSIELWDYDHLDADDLIGTTTIDIEDRWYSSKWRSLKYIPIETRHLYHPSSSLSQGTVKLWVEILPKDLPRPPLWHIAPKPEMEFELRVIVWECKDVPNVDFEDATDIYITGKLADGQQHRTDTHFRSQNGKGSFNWRMVFPIKLPMKKHRISFQIWDKDLLSANDYISEATFDFDLEAAKAFEKEETVAILGPSGTDQKFWVPCSNNKMDHGKAVQESMGSILVSMSLVPKVQAELTPVGQGRANPNQNPYLPPPEGRFEWTWNVIKLYQQLIGPLARRKILIWGGAICCAFILIMLLPMIIANVITNVF